MTFRANSTHTRMILLRHDAGPAFTTLAQHHAGTGNTCLLGISPVLLYVQYGIDTRDPEIDSHHPPPPPHQQLYLSSRRKMFLSPRETFAQCWLNVGPASQTSGQHLTNIVLAAMHLVTNVDACGSREKQRQGIIGVIGSLY